MVAYLKLKQTKLPLFKEYIQIRKGVVSYLVQKKKKSLLFFLKLFKEKAHDLLCFFFLFYLEIVFQSTIYVVLQAGLQITSFDKRR